MFFLPFNMIQAQHYTPAAAGAALSPFVLLISLLSRLSGRFAERHGARVPLTVGPLLVATAFGLLAMPGLDSSCARDWFPGIALLGLGMGVTVAPLTAAVMGAVEQTHAGVASGINNAIARTAGLLAIAALGLLLVDVFGNTLLQQLVPLGLAPSLQTSVLEQQTRLAAPDLSALPATLQAAIQRAFEQAFVTGFRALMLACAALSALAALIAALSIDRQAARPEA